MQEKKNYYEANDAGESLVEIEEMKTLNLKKAKFDLEGLYYSLDGHNFFKRKDRYKGKIFLLICFGYLSLYNRKYYKRNTALY